MKDEKFIEIAQKLGVAKSTVSRAARHCAGVDAETRRAVLRYTESAGTNTGASCDIYTILPDTPNYFWGKLHDGIVCAQKKTEFSVKQNIYTNLSDYDIVLRYLEEAEKIKPKVLLIAAHVTPEIREVLERLKKKCGVFFMTEMETMLYTFYIGADPYKDGFRMGQYYCENYANHTLIVKTYRQIPSIRLRTEGFCDALRQFDPKRFERIPMYDLPVENIFAEKRQLAPSRLASALSEGIDRTKETCLYIPYGSVALSLALQKARFGEKVACLCHDSMLDEDGRLESGIAVSMNQNIVGQATAAVGAAVNYIKNGMCPDGKYTYIPSEMVFGG